MSLRAQSGSLGPWPCAMQAREANRHNASRGAENRRGNRSMGVRQREWERRWAERGRQGDGRVKG